MRAFVQWITDQVAALGLALGDEVSAERLLVYAEDLCDIPEERLASAFQRARREYEYPKLPPIAYIRRLAGSMGESDGRPGPEEAWARMPKGERMEEDSIIWCDEERAAYAACRSLLVQGDQIGARMAFKERYERELAEARAQKRAAFWSVSAGLDVEQRLITLAAGVQEKRIGLEHAFNFIPEQRHDDFAHMLPPATAKGLLAGKVQRPTELPGLVGLLAKMRMQDLVPDDLKSNSMAPARSEPAPEDPVKRREELRAQVELIKRSRNKSDDSLI